MNGPKEEGEEEAEEKKRLITAENAYKQRRRNPYDS
jgi:hypothetical protein